MIVIAKAGAVDGHSIGCRVVMTGGRRRRARSFMPAGDQASIKQRPGKNTEQEHGCGNATSTHEDNVNPAPTSGLRDRFKSNQNPT